jgi:hypothetical protein
VGTLTAGTWTATAIGAAYGGTGLTTYAQGDLLYATSSSTLGRLADVVTGNALISGGVGSDPAWGKIGLQTHVDGTLQVTNGGTGATTLTGYVYGNGTGAFTASTSIPNSATTATSANTASAIVARDGSGNFSAGTITASLNGNASTATTAANVNNGTLTMAVSGTGLSGSATFTANQSGNSTFTVTSNATNANTASTIVARDASGNFSAGTITASLNGNASTATTASNVNNGTLTMNVSGTGLSGSQTFTANQSGNATFTVTSNATSANTASTIVARDGSGNFSAGTITATLSGNASTASNTSSISSAVGSSYTWTATQLFTGNGNTASASSTGPQAYSTGGNGAIMAFHRGGVYAINMGLDSDNIFRLGGWSASANRLQMDMSGNLTMAGNVTAYSDERLKKDWAPAKEGFIEELAAIKSGTYTRIDSGERQAGASAQDWQKLLPEVVSADNEGTLALAYGNAAVVACIELAKEIVALRAEIQALKASKE